MIKKLAVAIFILASFAGCQNKDAFNYSQEFVKTERSLLPDINQTENNVKRYIAAGQFDSMAVAGERMEKIVDEKIREIKDKPAPKAKEADNFKEAGIKYFNFIKSLYTMYKEVGNAKTPEEREIQWTKMKDIVDKKDAAVNDIQEAQKKYATANGFKMEK